MDQFDKHVKEEVQGYLNKHVHFSQEEGQQIRRKTTYKSPTKKFHGFYYIVLASTIVLLTVLSIPLFETLNFKSPPQFDSALVGENETEDKIASLDDVVNGKGTNRSQMISDEARNNLKQSIITNPEKVQLRTASVNYWRPRGEYKDADSWESITLALSFQSQQNSYFTQVFKGEVNLEDNHEVIEKVGDWSLIPYSETHSNTQENKYIIAVSEVITNHETYTIIVQTYDLHDDSEADPYSKTDILSFTESLKRELAVEKLIEITTEE